MAATCSVANGEVVSGGKKISYKDIVRKGGLTKTFTPEEIDALTIKPVDQRKLIGKPVTSLDVVAKTTGAARYGIDAKVEGMVYGYPIIPPTRNGGQVNYVMDPAAKEIKGYIQTIILKDPSNTVPGWAVVIGDTWWAAKKAAEAVILEYQPTPTMNVSEKDIQDHGRKLIADAKQGRPCWRPAPPIPRPRSSLRSSTIEAEYTTATALHFPMEPTNALALREGRQVGNPHRQPVAEPCAAVAGGGAGSARDRYRDEDLHAGRRLRSQAERRLCRRRGARLRKPSASR